MIGPSLSLHFRCHFMVLCAVAWVLSAAAAPSQEPTATPPLAFEGSASVSWAMIPLVVQSSDLDRPLRRQDLRLTVDGKAISFEDFLPATDEPTTVLLFQDLSGSMANGGKLEASRRAARCLMSLARPGDRMSVVTFAAGKTYVESTATDELAVVAELIDGWRGYGSTALHDAISWIPDVRLSASPQAAAVLVTDGVDNASVLTAEAARQLVRQAEIPVYVLALRGSRLDAEGETNDGGGQNPMLSPAVADTESSFAPYRTVLQRLAAATGGTYFDTFVRQDIDAACQRIANDLRNRYTLGFPLSPRGAEAFHPVRISVPGHRFTVRHRAGYLGRLPAALSPPP